MIEDKLSNGGSSAVTVLPTWKNQQRLWLWFSFSDIFVLRISECKTPGKTEVIRAEQNSGISYFMCFKTFCKLCCAKINCCMWQ